MTKVKGFAKWYNTETKCAGEQYLGQFDSDDECIEAFEDWKANPPHCLSKDLVNGAWLEFQYVGD